MTLSWASEGPKCLNSQPASWEVVGKFSGARSWSAAGSAGTQGEAASRQEPPARLPEGRSAQRQAPYLAVFHHVVEDRSPAATLVPGPPHQLVRVGLGGPR